MKVFNKIILIVMAIILVSCNSNIGTVKDGLLDFNKSLTVGEAFDNYKYFDSVEWTEFKTENGREVVQIMGGVNMTKHPSGPSWKKSNITKMEMFFQFIVMKDGETFEIQTGGLRMTGVNGKVLVQDAQQLGLTQLQLLSNLQEIYSNEPFN